MSTKVETAQQTMSSRERSFAVLHFVCRIILAATFGISSIQKFIFPTAFEKILQAYHLGNGIAHIAVALIPLLEFALAVTLLFGIVIRTSAMTAMVVLAVYTALMGVSLSTGNVNHGCGCFIGVSSSQSWATYVVGGNSITIADVIRDLLLLLVALVVWLTRDPKLGLDKFWTNSPDYWRWYRGHGYLTGALIIVFAVSTALAAMAEVNLNRVQNAPLSMAADFHPSAKIAIGKQAPNFSLQTANGAKYSLKAYRGKVVLLEFFAIWCSDCHAEAPIVNQLEKTFPATKFQVLSVIASPYSKDYETSNGSDTKPYTTADISWYKRTYHVENPILLDPQFSVTNEYIQQSYPNLILINGQGKIEDTYIGPTPLNKISAAIQKLLH